MWLLFAILVLCVIFFIIHTYLIYIILKSSINECNLFFNEYSQKCVDILSKYGDNIVSKVYLIRRPFGKIATFALNILSLFNYNKYINELFNNCPYHLGLILELKGENGIKWLLLEKNNEINVSERFIINETFEMKRIKLKKKCKLNEILLETTNRMGEYEYFNWNIYENNCQEFTKEILTTLNVYNEKYEKFIMKDKIIKKYFSPTDLMLHIINCSAIIMNFIETYFIDVSDVF